METVNAEQIRSFIAIELPDEIKNELKRLMDCLKAVDPGGAKWVDPSGIHLTLKFLGNIPASKVNSIVAAIQASVENFSPFILRIKDLGAFPNLKRAQVIWVGLDGDLDTLRDLQKKVDFNLSPLGFPPEKRSFTPHLTLARLRETSTPTQRQALGEILSRTRIDSNFIIKVNSLSLMRSQLTRSGAIYTRLSSIRISSSCQ
jgi:2'-5' RNA ligase